MSTFSVEQRPTMRRKSSAQNLLSSFKSSSASSTSTSAVPPPLNLSSVSVMNTTAMSFSSAATPTATTPLQRVEWDAQSLHSETVSSSLAGAQSPPLGQGTSIDLLRELVQKRIATLTYVRTIHEGYITPHSSSRFVLDISLPTDAVTGFTLSRSPGRSWTRCSTTIISRLKKGARHSRRLCIEFTNISGRIVSLSLASHYQPFWNSIHPLISCEDY